VPVNWVSSRTGAHLQLTMFRDFPFESRENV